MKSVFIYSLISSALLGLIRCKKPGSEKEELISISQMTTDYDSLIYKVKMMGDTNAYDELYYGFMDSSDSERTDSVLRYALIMSEKFNYERAYYDYLRALCEKNGVDPYFNSLSDLDLSKVNDLSKKTIIVGWLNQMLLKRVITQQELNSVRK